MSDFIKNENEKRAGTTAPVELTFYVKNKPRCYVLTLAEICTIALAVVVFAVVVPYAYSVAYEIKWSDPGVGILCGWAGLCVAFILGAFYIARRL